MDGSDETQTTPIVVPGDDDDFKIKGTANRSRNCTDDGQDIAAETCSICLESISERGVAVPCNHLTFDFLCLVSWLEERATCPLCNGAVTEVQYDFRSPEDYKTYRLSERGPQNESPFERSRRQRGLDFVRRRAGSRRTLSTQQVAAARDDPGLERRRMIYRNKLFSLHVGANNISQHRDFTTQEFANSPDLQSRARMFLRRELSVFTFLDTTRAPRGGNREFLLEYIVAMLRTHEVKGAGGHAEEILASYVGRDNSRLLTHELAAWLRSPHTTLEAWDRQVQYADDSLKSITKQGATG